MRYYSIGYLHHSGSLCEFRRFSSRAAAENCASMLNQAYICLTGDEDWKRFGVVESIEFSQWPDNCTGILKIDLDATFDR